MVFNSREFFSLVHHRRDHVVDDERKKVMLQCRVGGNVKVNGAIGAVKDSPSSATQK